MSGGIAVKQLPKKYWIYVAVVFVLAVLLFVNIFVTDGLTDEKEFSAFTQEDWLCFAAFILVEITLGVLMFVFAVKAGKLIKKHDKAQRERCAELKFAGIKQGDYDFVWFGAGGFERAKILKQSNAYYLYVESFDPKSEAWSPVNTVSVYQSLTELKDSLLEDFGFVCQENA